MSLPRELRDQVYEELLATTYQADHYGPIKIALSSPVSKSTYEATTQSVVLETLIIPDEASDMLYKKASWVFAIINPGNALQYKSFDIKVVPPFHNFEIYLDLITVWSFRLEVSDVELAVEATTRLILDFASSNGMQDTCIIIRLNHRHRDFPSLIPLVKALMKSTREASAEARKWWTFSADLGKDSTLKQLMHTVFWTGV